MRKSGAKRKTGVALTVAARRKDWQRHLDALGFATPRSYREWCRAQGFGPSLHKTWWQREQERNRAQRLAARAEAIRIQERHVAALGFGSIAEYEAWCDAHGFSRTRSKSEAQRDRETETRQRERAEKALVLARRRHDSPDALITAIYEGQVGWSALQTALERKIHTLFSEMRDKPAMSRALRELFLCACRYPALLSVEPAIPYLGPTHGNTYPDALLQLALRYRDWRRSLSEWEPRERRARDLFGSLVRHLLTEYPVPAFLDAVWFQVNGPLRQQQAWFLHVGSGSNIRTARDIPLSLTSMAAHHFLRAPRDLSIMAAMRWGQVMGMGGNRRLAQAIAASRLRDILPDEAFWTTVIQFFVNHPSLDGTQVGPVVDYIYHQRFEPIVILGPDGEEVSVTPQNPDFSMKGRTPAALIRQMQGWHRQLAELAKRPARQWAASGIRPLHLTHQSAMTGEVTFWTTYELLSSKELEEEGRAMHNCAATYISDCMEAESAIWSLRVWTPRDPTPRRVMTVEISPETRAIVQARGKCNRCASEPHAGSRLKAGLDALRYWAKQENMTLSPGCW